MLLGCLARGTHVSSSQTNLETISFEARIITAKQGPLYSNINISKIYEVWISKYVVTIQLVTHVFSFLIL